VAEARQKLLARIDANPDRFMRRDWLPLLYDVRAKTAELIGSTPDECMIVPNATHGINTIVNNIIWQPGDRIMICA
jgi:selenocysteine lyase/cysteine desulfurase